MFWGRRNTFGRCSGHSFHARFVNVLSPVYAFLAFRDVVCIVLMCFNVAFFFLLG